MATTNNAAGIPKADTLRPFIASVQRGAEVFFLASFDGKDRSSSATDPYDTAPKCMESSLVFPNEVAIYINGSTTALSLAANGTYCVNVDSTLFIVLNGVATGVRILQATDMSDSTTTTARITTPSAWRSCIPPCRPPAIRAAARLRCGRARWP